jgi:hypothetical protein
MTIDNFRVRGWSKKQAALGHLRHIKPEKGGELRRDSLLCFAETIRMISLLSRVDKDSS